MLPKKEVFERPSDLHHNFNPGGPTIHTDDCNPALAVVANMYVYNMQYVRILYMHIVVTTVHIYIVYIYIYHVCVYFLYMPNACKNAYQSNSYARVWPCVYCKSWWFDSCTQDGLRLHHGQSIISHQLLIFFKLTMGGSWVLLGAGWRWLLNALHMAASWACRDYAPRPATCKKRNWWHMMTPKGLQKVGHGKVTETTPIPGWGSLRNYMDDPARQGLDGLP